MFFFGQPGSGGVPDPTTCSSWALARMMSLSRTTPNSSASVETLPQSRTAATTPRHCWPTPVCCSPWLSGQKRETRWSAQDRFTLQCKAWNLPNFHILTFMIVLTCLGPLDTQPTAASTTLRKTHGALGPKCWRAAREPHLQRSKTESFGPLEERLSLPMGQRWAGLEII